ncbi:MAG: hypothetical protein N2043_01700 [Ignavibacterium sp.]|nr:hypothetical protein [Ignavibacterium sp.]
MTQKTNYVTVYFAHNITHSFNLSDEETSELKTWFYNQEFVSNKIFKIKTDKKEYYLNGDFICSIVFE